MYFTIMTKNEKLCEVFEDFKKNIEKKTTLSIIIVCAIIAMISVFFPQKTMEELCNNCISLFSSLLGFTITALAILYSLNKDLITKLLKKADDDTIPFDVLFTSFTLTALVQLLTIIMAFLCLIILSENTCSIIICIIAYLTLLMSLLSLGLIFNVILHLFTIRSFLKD